MLLLTSYTIAPQKILTEWKNLRNGFPQIVSYFLTSGLHIVDSIAEYGKVAIVWIVEAKHEKEFRGIPATHRKFETVGVNILHFEGNKIKEAWAVADGLSAALQLGVVKTESSQT